MAAASADALSGALWLTSLPAVIMLVASVLSSFVTVPSQVTAALQHLAAGIVMSAVTVELVPPIFAAPSDVANTTGMTVGFVLGISFFLILRKYCEVEDEDDGEVEDGGDHSHGCSSAKYAAMDEDVHGRSSSGPSSYAARGLQEMKRASLSPLPPSLPPLTKFVAPPFPFALTAAVAVDATVDGFLIGLASASGMNAGAVMACALAIEMGFLGLTFSASLRPQPRSRSMPVIVLLPLMLVVGGVVGSLIAELVSQSPALHIGLLSFGVAALLYLVTEELLLEAHGNHEEGHIWWVDAMFFFGFYLSFLLAKLFD